jgi:murein DD-endopeptidase MepM/ murein hydrolase activator NlpD
MLRSLAVAAAAPGKVIAVGYATGFEGYGNIVLVQVTRDVVTLYAHLSAYHVHVGQAVRRGELLGTAGCTGYCTGTHLHFEVRENGVPIDPRKFLEG